MDDGEATQTSSFPPASPPGGGLKQTNEKSTGWSAGLSPGLTAGGGLKRDGLDCVARCVTFPRPHRRGRIETIWPKAALAACTFPPASPPGAD